LDYEQKFLFFNRGKTFKTESLSFISVGFLLGFLRPEIKYLGVFDMAKLLILLSLVVSFESLSKSFIGKVPGMYLGLNKNSFYLAKISINGAVLSKVERISTEVAKRDKSSTHLKVGEKYVGLYPGLIDLHNHPKQCLLPLWDHAHGQFGNRHEWRDWSVYSHSLGGNMNPWSGKGRVEACAAFRWSELQALVQGTTLMQGPRFCTNNFSISHVESGDGFYNEKTDEAGDFVPKELNVQAPTDLFLPDEMTYIYKEIRPLKKENMSFHDALALSVSQKCPAIIERLKVLTKIENDQTLSTYNDRKISFDRTPTYNKFKDMNISRSKLDRPLLFSTSAIKFISTDVNRDKYCNQNRGKSFDLYFSKYHSSIASKILLLKHPNSSGMIAHLSEGRQKDPFNKLEFEIAKTLDLIAPGMNLVHAIGLSRDDLLLLEKNQVGIVWSPFSNLLLYGQTFKIEEALKLGINISLGSDWTPTGSKSVLEEVKIAKRFAVKNKIEHLLTDEILFKMITENPARMIKKLEVDPEDGRHGVGTLQKDAMASFIAVEIRDENPFTNLVDAEEEHIVLVVSKGDSLYGDLRILQKIGVADDSLDLTPVDYPAINSVEKIGEYEDIESYFNLSLFTSLKRENLNHFKRQKAFVFQRIINEDEQLISFKKATKLDMARPSDIQKVLHVLLTTQSKNAHGEKIDYHIQKLPPLFSSLDSTYLSRFNNFLRTDGSEDEVEENYVYRIEWRREKQSSRDRYNQNNPHLPQRMSVPYKLALIYGLEYDLGLGVVGY